MDVRRSMVVALAAGLFFTGAGSAMADSWRKMPPLTSGGVKFLGGQYQLYPKFTQHGGFGFRGHLKDDSPTDGHNVYVLAKVEGYGWRRFNGKQRRTVKLNKVVYDGAALYVRTAEFRACRDRGSLRPDNCSKTLHYER
ncbi:hypothetical protein AB0J21_04190 [Streptomyces sp. NPDC049954]|uniref:hypothetical protein n=1 Tax=Streptomyces sp. NPDC049954 TaxID=3155779 RepID=UPI00341287D4